MRRGKHGFAMLAVMGVIFIAAFVLVVIQSAAMSQASGGREELARVRAYWAARGGIEATIAKLEEGTRTPNTDDAYALLNDMAEVADGTLEGASFTIRGSLGKTEFSGPADAHAKLNINIATRDQLLTIEPFMAEDIADSILDWIDEDDDVREVGAELGYYQSTAYAYLPRNGSMQNIQELELVAGVDPQDVRGEDWNLNGILDDNENDGDVSWPPDNADGILDAEWSGVLTASSVDGGLAASGEARLLLSEANAADLVSRTKVSTAQADAILQYAQQSQNPSMRDFVRRSLRQLAQQAAQANGQTQQVQIENLTSEQLGLLLNECVITEVPAGTPAKININTCDDKLFDYLLELGEDVAETLRTERAARSNGFSSIAEVLDIDGISRNQAAVIYDYFDVRSNVFELTSRGVDSVTGVEVEITATIDRSTLPVVVKEMYLR
jgi:type II secretory pathway component PulK